MIALFAAASPAMQDIAAALIDGDHDTVDALTRGRPRGGHTPRSR